MSKAEIAISAVDKTKAAFDSASRNLRGLGEQASALPAKFGTLGIAIAAAFSAVSVKSVIDGADELNKLSQKTGIAVESLSELKYAGSLADVSIEQIANSVKKLSTNMFDAAGGSKEVVETFDQLGVAFKNADGSLRDADSVLGDLAESFSTLPDGPEKSALAVKAFGKAGTDLIPLLNAGRGGLEAMREEARKLGVVMSAETAKAAEDFNDNLTRMGAISSAASKDIAARLLPTMVDLTDAFVQARKEGGGFTLIADGVATAFEAVVVLGANIAYVFKSIGDTLGGIAAQAAAIARLDFKGVGVINDAIKENNLANRRKVEDFSSKVLNGRENRRLAASMQGDGFGDGTIGGPAKSGKPRGGGGSGGKPSSDKSVEQELKKQADLILQLNGITANFADEWARLGAIYAKGSISLKQLADAQAELLSKQPAIKAQADLEERLGAMRTKNEEATNKHADALAAENDAIVKSNQSLRQEMEELGLNAEAVTILRLARMDANIVREEEGLIDARNAQAGEAVLSQMERRVALLKEERIVKGESARRELLASDTSEAQRRTQTISESISDGLLDGFRNGRRTSDVFLSELKSRYSKTVLQPIIKPIVEAGNQLITDALKGVSGGGGGGGGGVGGFLSKAFGNVFGGGGGGFMNDMGGMELAGSLGFDGGGYTGNGPRTGGLDGKGGFMAMMHPQETVVDHSKGQKLGGGTVVNNNYTFGPGVSRSEVIAGLQAVRTQAQADQSEISRRRRSS